jgi:imidazoleglycerol-phosphate dehydratase
MATIRRKTKETRIDVRAAKSAADSPAVSIAVRVQRNDAMERLAFFEHMLTALATYAGLDLTLEAEGDLRHHVMEDVALALGRAVREIAPEKAARYGEQTIPMDDALVSAVVDVGGRPWFAGALPSRLYTHVLRSFATELGATLHVRVLAGEDRHHVIEAAFKSTGLALRKALVEGRDVFSTKGKVGWEIDE